MKNRIGPFVWCFLLGSTCSLAADNTVEIACAQITGSGTPAEVSIRNGGLRLELVDAGKEPGLRAYVVYFVDGASSDSVVRVGSLDKAVPFSTGPTDSVFLQELPGVPQAAQFAMLNGRSSQQGDRLRPSKQKGEGLESTIWKNSSGSGSGSGAFVICSSTTDTCR